MAGKLRTDLWTTEKLKQARRIVSECTSLTEAAARVSVEMRRPTNGYALKQLFLRRGLPDPINLLKAADPVQRAVHTDATTRLRREHAELVERVREYEARQAVLDRFSRPVEPYAIRRTEKRSGLREGVAVALASDWHVEEYVPSRPDTNFNHYNLEIADTRVNRFFNGVRWLLDFNRQAFVIRKQVLWLGGDLITGYLRNENREENELSPVEGVAWLFTRLMAGIKHLLADPKLEELVIVCSHGNHGRTTEKRQIATGAKNSFEWLLYQWLSSAVVGEPRVKFITDQSNHQYVDVEGPERTWQLHFHHGDEVGFNGGVGGLAVPLMKAVAGWDRVRQCDYHHIGHFHQYTDYGSATVNGSLIGYNAFAMSIRAFPEPPQQAFYILDNKRGKSVRAPIWVGE